MDARLSSMRRAKRVAKAILKTLTVEDYVAVIEAKSPFRNYWDHYVHSVVIDCSRPRRPCSI